MNEEEVWDYGNYWEEGQLKKEENKDLYVLRLFYYTVQFITLLICKDYQKIIPKGDHFIKGFNYWIKRRELSKGCFTKVA